MKGSISITRRLVVTVLALELLAAIALIGAITVHERHMQFKALDSSLVASTESLMGAVQDTEDTADDVMLDMRGVQVAKDSVFRVEDERGHVLGTEGDPPPLKVIASEAAQFRDADVNGRHYRFLIVRRLRVVDPGQPDGGVRHSITIVYGIPADHVWHEVLEAVRFFAISTALLLGGTGAIMAWLVRKELSPVQELAQEAERISSKDWRFDAPDSAKKTVELKPLTAALEAALARLERSFEQQKRFTNDAAHELKTDVAIVKSSLQLLSMRKRTAEEYSQGLALSLDDFTRLETTVQKMLTLARLEQPAENHSSAVPLLSCSLRDAIEEAVHQSKPLAELKSISLNIECLADANAPIDARDALLLCSNILLNALQHSPEGAAVQVAARVDQETVRLTVRDHGDGISDADRAHLFEPFYRSDRSRSRKSGGTGLGLSICKAICDRAGGSIEITNSAGGGALVTVNLPATAPVSHSSSSSFSSASLKAD
ncbi:MAG: HAMP domain-containing sensor histidine kinase [Terriglobales bacterium]